MCQKQVFITKKQREILTFSFFISLKIKFVKKITKKDKKNCQKLSKVAQKAEKLPAIVLLMCTLRCSLIQPKNKKQKLVSSKTYFNHGVGFAINH